MKRWRRTVHKELRRAGLPDDGSETYAAAIIAAAVYGFGTNLDVLAELTGRERTLIRTVLKRFRATRVLVGQTLRVGWDDPKGGAFALILDAMVGGGDIDRPPDETRSAAQKARKSSGQRKPYKPRSPQPQGVYSPKVRNTDPFYGLKEWREGKKEPR